MVETTLIRCGKLFDGTAGSLFQNREILVRGGVMEAVGERLSCPEGTQVVDLTGLLVTPGLIDAHIHPEFFDRRVSYSDYAASTDERLALGVLHTAEKALMSGFTTLRALGSFSRGFGLVDVREAIERGYFTAARLVVSAHGLTTTGGHGDLSKTIGANPQVSGMLQSRGAGTGPAFFEECVRREVKYGADYIKILPESGISNDATRFHGGFCRQEMSDEEIAAVISCARRLEIPVTAHAVGARLIRKLVEMGVNGIEHGWLLDEETARMMEEQDVYLVPTFAPLHESLAKATGNAGFLAESRLAFLRSREIMFSSKIRLGFGSDFVSNHPSWESWREYPAWIAYGAEPLRALRAATSDNAAIVGNRRLGKIAPGMIADLAAWPCEVLERPELLADCRFVMKEGAVVKPAAQ